MEKRLYRSRKNSVIAGVCGGLGEYFDIDPTIIRIIAVILALAKGIGLLAYIIAWIIIPQRGEGEVVEEKSGAHKYLPGLILILLGLVFLLENFIPWLSFGMLWPLILVAIGIALLAKALSGGKDENL